MVEKSTSENFENIFARIQDEIGIKSIRQFAEMIGKNHTTILSAKSKNNFPANWAWEIEKKYGLLTRWIMTGKGPKRLEDKKISFEFELLNEFEEWLKSEVRKDPKRKDWFEVQLLDSFQTFKEWKRKRDQGKGGGDSFSSSKVA